MNLQTPDVLTQFPTATHFSWPNVNWVVECLLVVHWCVICIVSRRVVFAFKKSSLSLSHLESSMLHIVIALILYNCFTRESTEKFRNQAAHKVYVRVLCLSVP